MKQYRNEDPNLAKLIMCEDVAHVIFHLHHGQRSQAEPLIKDLKTRSLLMGDKIQQDVLIFSEQVQFQYDYDPQHLVTPEVQKAADHLLKDLGIEESF